MRPQTQLILAGAEVPSVPQVLQRILATASNPRSSSRDLEALIVEDPGLVAHLLKTVNSAYYAHSQSIDSIGQAMFLLGFSAVRSIASGLALIDAFHNLPGLNKSYVMDVWCHSLAAAALIKVLVNRENRAVQDRLFLTAMIHNVGHLVLAQYFQARYDALIRRAPRIEIEHERACFEVDHAEVGAGLLASWRYPQQIVRLVEAHHELQGFEGESRELRYLELSIVMAGCGEGLQAFLSREESGVAGEFLTGLDEIAWSWTRLQDQRETLVGAMAFAQTVTGGLNGG